MAIWYQQYGLDIIQVEIASYTDLTVVLPNGLTRSRDTPYSSYHPTWESAKKELIHRQKRRIENKSTIVGILKQQLEEIEKLENPCT